MVFVILGPADVANKAWVAAKELKLGNIIAMPPYSGNSINSWKKAPIIHTPASRNVMKNEEQRFPEMAWQS